jgi:D-beta-D-heptose 7-phosphate kinase/D-beta-D-heptose 1-phosphate adenosyltransferase
MNASWVAKWHGSRIFVLGDVMLDRFVYGQVKRISPEAPIPVLQYQSEKCVLGGAANVARNIVALGGEALLVGVLGNDADGDLLAGPLISSNRIEGRFVRAPGHQTTAKMRYVSGGQQIMRLDVERLFHPSTQDIEAICGWLLEAIDSVSAIVLSDYAKGVLVPALIRRVVDIAHARAVPVIVDPKSGDVARYAGATVLTPNAAEAAVIAGIRGIDDDDQAEMAAKILRERAEVDAIVLTRGALGVTIYDPAEPEGPVAHLPTAALEIFDVAGAGDTLIAAFALAFACGASIRTAARIGNAAAGIAVGKRGTAVVYTHELSAALGGAGVGEDPKIVHEERAATIVGDWRLQGLKVGFTNGGFDLVHPGHVELLRRSRAVCDRLIVALNTDASIHRLKGETRPVQNERARSVVVAAISSVDLVTLFDEDTPLRLIELLRPDFLIKGADYTAESVIGANFVRSYGGKVVLVPLERGHSTTSIIARATARAT